MINIIKIIINIINMKIKRIMMIIIIANQDFIIKNIIVMRMKMIMIDLKKKEDINYNYRIKMKYKVGDKNTNDK